MCSHRHAKVGAWPCSNQVTVRSSSFCFQVSLSAVEQRAERDPAEQRSVVLDSERNVGSARRSLSAKFPAKRRVSGHLID